MKNLILLILFVFTPLVKAQTTSCQDVYEFILDKGYKANSINLVYSSSMLVKVERYTYDAKNYVVGFIKQNDYDSKGAPYLFCGVSSYDIIPFFDTFKNEVDYNSLIKFSKYKPSVSSEELMKQGFKGKELGEEIKRIESEIFKNY